MFNGLVFIVLVVSLCYLDITMSFIFKQHLQRNFESKSSLTKIRAIYSKSPSAYSSPARPSLDDVERISKGLAAKKRGVGSRNVPHRLNEEERIEWNLCKQRQFLILRGTGFRRERGDAPLASIYRNLCDAKGIPCVSITKALGTTTSSDPVLEDILTIDFSPLRTTNIQHLVKLCLSKCPIINQDTSNDSHNDTAISTTTTTALQELNTDPNSNTHFSSITLINDFSDLTKTLGWHTESPSTTAVESVLSVSSSAAAASSSINFDTEPIWRIPVYGLQIKFSSRAECKKFAEMIISELLKS